MVFSGRCIRTDVSGNYHITLQNIAAAVHVQKFCCSSQCSQCTITVTNTSDEVVNVITTSVLSYARSVLNNPNNTEAKKDLVRALYLYNQAANAHLGF